MEVQEEINRRMSEYLSSTKFSEELQKSVEGLVNETVKSMFSYGEIRDAVRKGFAERIGVDLNQINFPQINQVIVDLVKKKCHAAFQEPMLEKLAKELDDMFQPAPKEITLQKLIDLWKDGLDESCSCDGVEEILVKIERSEYDKKGSGTLKIWDGGKSSSKSLYGSGDNKIDPDLHIYINEKGVIRLLHDVMSRDARNSLSTGIYGKEAKIFMMYCAGTVITDFTATEDACDLDTSIGRHH